MNFSLLVSRAARFWGDRTAIVSDDGCITFTELEAGVQSFAGRLRSAGVDRGDRVAIMVGNRWEWYEAFFATLRLGAVAVGADQDLPEGSALAQDGHPHLPGPAGAPEGAELGAVLR